MEQQQSETYFAVVMATALQKSKSGTESVAIQFQATRNLSSGDECDKKFVGYLYLSSRAVENAIKTLRDVFGYTEKSFYPLNRAETLEGKDCEITVVHEEYNGKISPKVQWINKTGHFESRTLKAIDDAEAREMCARLDAYFSDAQSGTSAPTKSIPKNEHQDQLWADNILPF